MVRRHRQARLDGTPRKAADLDRRTIPRTLKGMEPPSCEKASILDPSKAYTQARPF